ncbi:CDP-alcohol phosphatidyltransferase family protein [Ilumatobacter nonamiensis]|uniref:CDP-alcohol phosphatidyltransferase family protein n=1 Tax=Ilumatobacter nonamiensis TaxID=467093 RepID=UPI00058EDC87|nr:CDP-alcohol phosphatidyltransferase family protein [Ilumatobacter nonamiensis]
MLDSALRPVKDRLLAPFARSPVTLLHPAGISAIGLGFGLGAAIAAWQQLPALAVVLWLTGRLADGLDGIVARETDRSTDAGGLIDFVFDTLAYAAIPLGLAFGADDRATWIATAVVLASFYVNAVSLGYIAALLEKRALGAAARGEPTSATLPRGLIEGTETIVFFTIALAFPDAAATVWWVMAVAVVVTALERVRWAIRLLR